MNNYMLPVDEKFVEEIAKAIAKSRVLYEATPIIEQASLNNPAMYEIMENIMNDVFENAWNSTTEFDHNQRNMFCLDAKSAIAAINLKLLTFKE